MKINDSYKNTKIYKSINFDDKNQKNYLIQVISAYQNFIDYLKNDNIIIDYTYLWDLICLPNKNLFKDGLKKIVDEAFCDCESLQSIKLPSTVEICDYAFSQCTNLREVIL